MSRKGYLLVLMHPPTALEEEFNAWYDTEHVPDRLAIPGFESGTRFHSLAGGAPRYLAFYDLASVAVIESPEYLRVSFDQATPWTKRITARARVQRFTGEQIYSGGGQATRPARLLLLRFRGLKAGDADAIVTAMRASFGMRPEVRRVRVLAHDAGSAGTDFIGLVDTGAPMSEQFDPTPFGLLADALDMVGTYTPF
ncbi:hypothetical protein EBE87_18950 [Pseudoroseomonas wenyumeiae]|uniref:EthD domain-containing protein n=1 Tax=Teichococcus wenyumeiae TaxID=2478470 RepID=A0A3A9JZD6_9PROT|nr:DUF4286 family protein [Pseudoroseomonas wenyumeiae]RKK06228.1 hypothetical protein D6Z83_00180 [Pseudoroseomonas wenyumeiae]RMI19728.1 hypothetical protein EBE87_18950 [Pseudoroseomonas wenyumeiae]